MRLGRSNLNANNVTDSNKLERDLSEKPFTLFRILLWGLIYSGAAYDFSEIPF
jgi:hypothetical protein